jgi:hypothetical protein
MVGTIGASGLHRLARRPVARHEVDQRTRGGGRLRNQLLVVPLCEELIGHGGGSATPATVSILDRRDPTHLGVPFATDHELILDWHRILQLIRAHSVGEIDLSDLDGLDVADQLRQSLDLVPRKVGRELAERAAPDLEHRVDVSSANRIEVALDDLDRAFRLLADLALLLFLAAVTR